MSGSILVAGVGNIFLGDDAFGVEVVRRLATRSLPLNVQVMDFGIRGYDLAYALMEPWELVILVDAMPRGEEPGTVFLVEAELTQRPSFAFDAHSMNPAAVLQLVSDLGGKSCRILVVGCEPSTVDADQIGEGALSQPVRAAVDEAICMIEELVTGINKTTAA